MAVRSNETLKTLVIVLSILLVVGLVAYYLVINSQREQQDSTARLSLDPGEAQSFTDTGGNPVDLSEFENRIRVVNSWATWVPQSKTELSDLNKLAEAYNKEEVVFLAINRKEYQDYAATYLTSSPPLDRLIIVFDPADNYFVNIDGYAMPETVVFDRYGEVAAHWRGPVKLDELRQTLDQLLSR